MQILLLHGAIGAKDQLEPLADLLKEQQEVHSLNFNGHGGQPFSEKGFSIPVFAEEVKDWLEKHQLSSVNIFGYSMGGYVGMWLARQYPGLVRKIITLGTKYHWDEETAAKELKMLDAEKIEEKLPAFAEQLKQRHAPNDWKMVLEKTRNMLIGLGEKNALQLSDYATIDIPALLLLGDKDKMVTREETVAVAKALPKGRFQLLVDTPHPVEQVNVEMLAILIKDFFL